MPQFPSLPQTAHLTDLMVRFPKNARPLMTYINAVLRSEGILSIADRELIAAYVSGLNACTFCFGSHEIYARAFGIKEGLIAHLLENPETAEVDPKLIPLLEYVKALTTLPSKMTPQMAEHVFDAGWPEEALFEAVEICGVFNLMNRMIEGAGVNFDYADHPDIHQISQDKDSLANSYLNYADRIENLVQASET